MPRNNVKQTASTQHLVPKPTRHAPMRVVHAPPGNSPYDLEPGFEFLRSLIEARVVERLETIFEQVRRLEASGTHNAHRRAIRLREVLSILGVSKSTLYSRLSLASPSYDPEMPKPFKLGNSKNSERAPSVWWESDVIAYLDACQARHSS